MSTFPYKYEHGIIHHVYDNNKTARDCINACSEDKGTSYTYCLESTVNVLAWREHELIDRIKELEEAIKLCSEQLSESIKSSVVTDK